MTHSLPTSLCRQHGDCQDQSCHSPSPPPIAADHASRHPVHCYHCYYLHLHCRWLPSTQVSASVDAEARVCGGVSRCGARSGEKATVDTDVCTHVRAFSFVVMVVRWTRFC